MQFSLPSQKQDCINYVDRNEENLVAYFEKPKRSKQQNRTYWNNIDILAKYSGHTNDEMSAIIKNWITKKWTLKMLYYIQVKWENVPVETSTADLNTKDFWLLMDYVFQIGNTLWLQMDIPDNWLIEFATDLFS